MAAQATTGQGAGHANAQPAIGAGNRSCRVLAGIGIVIGADTEVDIAAQSIDVASAAPPNVVAATKANSMARRLRSVIGMDIGDALDD